MTREKTIIRIRKGINGHKYSACNKDGYFIGNFDKLADVRKHWKNEIKWGQVELIRELNEMPDMRRINATIKALDHILTEYGRKKNK